MHLLSDRDPGDQRLISCVRDASMRNFLRTTTTVHDHIYATKNGGPVEEINWPPTLAALTPQEGTGRAHGR